MAERTFEVPLASGRLLLDADDQWAEEAQGLLAHLASLPHEQLADLTVDTGWTELRVGPSSKAPRASGPADEEDLRLRGPSFGDPSDDTDDLTPHLAAMVAHAQTAALLAIPAASIRFDDEITVEGEALAADEIYIKRLGGTEGASGWHLGRLTAQASEHIHVERRPAYQIVERFPALLHFLALPDNYLVGLVAGEVDAVFNPEGKRVMGRGGVPRLEAHPTLLTAAAHELGITEPEALVRSLYHPGQGYFLVWREEPAAMVALHPSGEQLRLQGLVGPDEFAELWERGDRTPPGYSLN